MEALDIWGRPATETPHRFEWALEILRAGGKVRRSIWTEGNHIFVNEHNILVCQLAGELSPIRRVSIIAHHCDWAELTATDWTAHEVPPAV